jgi:tetratricopeptide (TPR) repeat protein
VPGLASPQQPDRFESLLASAQDAQARSDFQAAAEFYRQAIDLHPEIPELRANLGLMYYQTSKDEQASEAFRQALRIKPDMFVPNLFLGLGCVKSKRFDEAVPYFKQAARSKPGDVQVQLGLGQAYAGSGKTRLASAAYTRAGQLEPGNADTWYHLGVSYLEQVEADARILLIQHKDSSYVQALVAETFAEQRALVQADDAYRKVFSEPKFPAGAHANYGFVLLNRHDLAGAERELKAELTLNAGSLLGKLGLARLHLTQGDAGQAAKELADIGKTDAGFLGANAALFIAGLPQAKREQLQAAFAGQEASGTIPPGMGELFTNSTAGDRARETSPAKVTKHAPGAKVPDATKLFAKGSYQECSEVLAPRLEQLPVKELELLATCSYLTGDYRTVLPAVAKLASNPATEVEGLYWETKSVQKLATEALTRASATDSSSPKLHVLLGDLFRQRKAFPDAEQEYRKALALRPDDAGALFGLSLALLADGQNDEALSVAQSALGKDPDDPEFNAVMGEILCARDDYSGAEPFLKKSLNTKPEFVSRVHALLGNVYAKTDRIPEAIAELKLALAGDKDGSLHYQIGRLYLKVGDREAAKQALDVSKRMQQENLTHAAVAIQQGAEEKESQ